MNCPTAGLENTLERHLFRRSARDIHESALVFSRPIHTTSWTFDEGHYVHVLTGVLSKSAPPVT